MGHCCHTISPAASAAKEKGSGGPVRWRRENETLSEIREKTLQ